VIRFEVTGKYFYFIVLVLKYCTINCHIHYTNIRRISTSAPLPLGAQCSELGKSNVKVNKVTVGEIHRDSPV